MAKKTFISYKYSDAKEKRDQIVEAFGVDATYYRGETSDSPYIGDLKTDTIKRKLADMIYDTSVMIVIISANVDESEWIEWEVDYATSTQTRRGRKSHPNGIVLAVSDELLNSNNRYTTTNIDKLLSKKDVEGVVRISFNNFLKNPNKYIEQAYNNRPKIY